MNPPQVSFDSYQLRFIHDAPLGATINEPILIVTTLSAYVAHVSDRRNNWSINLVATTSSSNLRQYEREPLTDEYRCVIHLGTGALLIHIQL